MKKSLALIVGAAVLALGVPGTAWAAEQAQGKEAAANGCVLVTGLPYKSGSNVAATTGRTGCSESATVYMKLMRDVNLLPDTQVATRQETTKDKTWTLSGKGTSGHKYYSEVSSSTGAKQQSSRFTF
ncbi:MAG: hypothetical protein LBK95_19170 [Bifidobacteriaceae bacterium]|jgi:hypothetical protein|nr:hypothetical protein [Bifidobacteriaceae bacterium]